MCFSLRKAQLCCCQARLRKSFKGTFECAFSAMKRQALKNQEYFNPNTIATAKVFPSTLYKAPSFSSPSIPQSSGSSLCPPSPSVSSNTTTENSVSTLSAVSPSPTVSPWCSQNGGGCTGLSEQPRATSTPVPSPVVNPLGWYPHTTIRRCSSFKEA